MHNAVERNVLPPVNSLFFCKNLWKRWNVTNVETHYLCQIYNLHVYFNIMCTGMNKQK